MGYLSEDVDRPKASPLQTARVRSATDVAKSLMEDMIESGELRPGERIDPDTLAGLLEVSRTPVRDALHQLRAEGIVDIQPRKGAFVRNVSPKEIDEVYALKLAVEPIAADWAAKRGSGEAKSELARLATSLQDAGAVGDVRLAAHYVDQIHNLIFEIADSPVLRDVYSVFHGRVKRLRHLNMDQSGRLDTSLRQHAEIVKLIVTGNASEARNAMAEHMRDASASVRNVPGAQ